jgi:ribosomal protein S18 acetylase RimI-like enzyme
MTSNEKASVRLRPVAPEDEAFLYKVYAGVRGEELDAMGWDKAQQEFFLKMQLRMRDQSYLMYYPQLDDQIILFRNEQVGRLMVSRTDEAIRLVDIALLPEHRGAGIGTFLIKDLFDEADETNRPIRLQVEKTNPQALSLYERLGFSVTSENQTHFQMERQNEGMMNID